MQAESIARKRSVRFAVIGLIVGLMMTVIAPSFLALNAVMAAVLGLIAGQYVARDVWPIYSEGARGAGGVGGMYAGLAFAVPLMAYFGISLWTLDEAGAAARLRELTQIELDSYTRYRVMPGLASFQTQDTSYLFFYLIFGLLLGWIFGMIGSRLSRTVVAR
jgi:hypothetical protein